MKNFFILCLMLFSLAGAAQTSEITTVYFDFDKHSLTPSAIAELNSFLEKYKTKSIKIELYGHCDFKGNNTYNDALSDKRVQSVQHYLTGGGIAAETIATTKGYGKRAPLNENATAEEQQLNRRVEIKITSNSTNPEPEIVITPKAPDSSTVTIEKNKIPEKTLTEKLADSTLTVGTNIALRNINFAGGLHQFLPSATPMLQELLNAMIAYPKLVIRIEGHICCISEKGDGMDFETNIYNLSYARAKAVNDYLVANGIDKRRISYKGFGHSAPIYPYPEKSEEEIIANRRVEIKIISK